VLTLAVTSSSDHSLSSAMAGKRKRPSAQDEQANAMEVVEDHHVLFTRIRLRYTTEREDAVSAILDMYQTCKTWRNELVDVGFSMRTFSLCRALADGNSSQTLQRVQATIGRQLERTSDQVETHQAWLLDERGWWLDARSLVQRCRRRVGSWTVWSWLQAASQEPDGPLSRQAAATARVLGQHLVCWPDKPQLRFPWLCTLRGHSAAVNSVAFSPDGTRVVSASGDSISSDNTVRIWDVASGKEVGASGPGHARYDLV